MAFAVITGRGGLEALLATNANLDGDAVLAHAFPSDDVTRELLSIMIAVTPIATVMTNPEIHGPTIDLFNASSAMLRNLGAPWWNLFAVDGVRAYLALPPGVLAIAGDQLITRYREVDVNATVTGDVSIYVFARQWRGE